MNWSEKRAKVVVVRPPRQTTTTLGVGPGKARRYTNELEDIRMNWGRKNLKKEDIGMNWNIYE